MAPRQEQQSWKAKTAGTGDRPGGKGEDRGEKGGGGGGKGEKGKKGGKGGGDKGASRDEEFWEEPEGGKRGKGKGGGGGGGGGGRKGGRDGGDDGEWNSRGGGRDRRGGGGKGDDTEGPAVRTWLNSSAPDFQPSGNYGYGGYDDNMGGQYWGWQQPAAPVRPPLWREYADADSVPYYYNSKTGLCQWERPPELDPPKPVIAPPPAADLGSEEKAGREGDRDRSRRDTGNRDRDREEKSRRGGGDFAGGDRGGARGGDARRDRDRGGGDRGGGDRGGGGDGDKRGNRRRGKNDEAAKKEASEFGPPGCNLFVFHLPDDWTDDDLHEYFAPHGNVVSAKVMKELGTGRSRGFGFVSYEDRVSAATAVKKMQGYKILGKRLKVEFKKGEVNDSKELDDDRDEDDEGGKRNFPDDERLIGYLRAISAKNVVQTLKESEGGAGGGDADLSPRMAPKDDDDDDGA